MHVARYGLKRLRNNWKNKKPSFRKQLPFWTWNLSGNTIKFSSQIHYFCNRTWPGRYLNIKNRLFVIFNLGSNSWLILEAPLGPCKTQISAEFWKQNCRNAKSAYSRKVYLKLLIISLPKQQTRYGIYLRNLNQSKVQKQGPNQKFLRHSLRRLASFSRWNPNLVLHVTKRIPVL